MKKFMLAAAALTMAASPVMAAPTNAKGVPAAARSADKAGESELRGGFIVPLIAVIAIIIGIILITDKDDKPNSP